MLFRRKRSPVVEAQRSPTELAGEIAALTEATRASRDIDAERRLLALRHEAGIAALDSSSDDPEYPAADGARLPESDGLPEFTREQVTPELLRAAILRDGCLLVRGLVDRERALGFAAQIERSFAERERESSGQAPQPGYYEPFAPDARFGEVEGRDWIKQGGGVLAADSPLLAFEMFELFSQARVPELAKSYLGEAPLLSVQKTTLRKADPAVGGAWHQDGYFLGDVRALNLWLSLSRCGDVAPGLDIVPRRLDDLVATQTDEAILDYQVSQARAEEVAGDKGIMRPIFEPGDALFFDDRFLHQTGSDPSMPEPRFAIESWFFGASGFPVEYAPLAA
jgi:hypothetical protein